MRGGQRAGRVRADAGRSAGRRPRVRKGAFKKEVDFKAVFESAPGLFLLLKPDFTIAGVSDAYLHATMTKREEIDGRYLFDVFPDNPADPGATGAANLTASLKRVLASRRSDTMAVQKYDIRRPAARGGAFEERYWSPVNSPILNADGEVLYIIHRVEDVTEFVRAKERFRAQESVTERAEAEIFARNQELQSSQRQLQTIIDAMPVLIAYVDRRERYVFNNRGYRDWFGLSPEELKGTRVEDVLGAAWYGKIRPLMDKALAGQGVSYETEVSIRGRKRWVKGEYIPDCDPDRSCRGFFVLVSDLTAARQRAEETEAFRLMVENVADYAIFMLTPDGHVASWNLGAQRIKGYKAEEIVGKDFSAFYRPEDAAAGKPRRELTLAAEKGRFEEENWRVRKDGSKFWAHVVVTPLRDKEGALRGFVKLTRDISRRKLEEERFRSVVEASPNAMILVGADGRISFVNSETERLFLYRRDELIGREIEILVPQRFRAMHPGYRSGFFAAPTARPMGAGRDLFGLRKDGKELPIEIGLNPIETPEGTFVLASIIDITERRRSEERFRLVVEGSPNAIVMVGREGKIAFVNSQAERLFLYGREELVGKKVETLVPERFRASHPGYREGFFSSPNARPMGAGRDLFGLRKDGSEVPVEIGLTPLHTPDGQFVLASIIDITERKKAEEELARKAAELEAIVAQRTKHLQEVIEQLETFSYTASHDLRAPLRAVQGYAFFVMQKLGDKVEPAVRIQLERMADSAARMDRLVKDLLTYSRVARGEQPSTEVDLDAIAAHIVERYPGLEKAAIEIKPPLGRVLGQESLVTQALSNLIGNAVKFIPAGRAPRIRIWTDRREGRITLFVEDNGIGIAEEYIPKLFSPFTRLHGDRYEGTGIGLAIVKKAAERMGGRVGVSSEVDKGSRFWVELPEARA